MGDCYTVRMKLIRNNDVGLKQILDDYLADFKLRNPDARLRDESEMKSADGTLLRSLERLFPLIEQMDDAGTEFAADFDASYGWASVMFEVCEAMAPQLLGGSYVEIWYEGHAKATYSKGQFRMRHFK